MTKKQFLVADSIKYINLLGIKNWGDCSLNSIRCSKLILSQKAIKCVAFKWVKVLFYENKFDDSTDCYGLFEVKIIIWTWPSFYKTFIESSAYLVWSLQHQLTGVCGASVRSKFQIIFLQDWEVWTFEIALTYIMKHLFTYWTFSDNLV